MKYRDSRREIPGGLLIEHANSRVKTRAEYLARNLLFTLIIWSALALLAEAILRAAEPFSRRSADDPLSELLMCEPDAARIWRYKPLYHQVQTTPEFRIDVRTNEMGLREGPVPAGRQVDVLVVGDSFTFGWGVEQGERYSDVLERRLSSEAGAPGSRVVNAGHWMYSFDQQLLVIRELVPRLRPRVVLQGLYPPHLQTLMSHTWERDGQGQLTTVINRGVRVGADGSLRFTNEHLENPPFRSRLVGAVFRIWFNWRLSREGMTSDLGLLDPAATRFALAWRMLQETLNETASYLRSQGVEYVAFGIPRDLQVSDREWTDRYREAVKGKTLDLDLPTRRFGETVRRAGGTWVDLLPTFRQNYVPGLYFKTDPHWTSEGHKLAAEALLPTLVSALRSGGSGPGSPGVAQSSRGEGAR